MSTIDKTTVMKSTTDDWYPNYDNDMVRLRYIKLPLSNGMYRVCVWGNDDFGMEYDTIDINEAKNMFKKLEQMPIITQKCLKELGFVIA